MRAPDSASPAWRSRCFNPALLVATLALLASFIAFGDTLGGYFLGDDFGYVARFSQLPFSA